MILQVLKAMKLLAVDPPAIRFARLQFHFHHARFMVGLVMRFAQRLRIRILPGGGPAPRLVGHFFAERDFDFVFAGRNIPGTRFGNGFDDDWREGINVLRAGIFGGNAAKQTRGDDGERYFCFHGLFSLV